MRERNLKSQELEPEIHLQENAFKRSEIISDNNEQCSRRSCLLIECIEFKEKDGVDVMKEIENCCHMYECFIK